MNRAIFDARAADERSPLVGVASDLAGQCEALGRFALAGGDWTDDFYVNRVAGRISAVRSLLLMLERVSPLVIADTERPFLFWPALTPGSHPPGGYVKWEAAIDPKTYVESLIAAWLYQLDMKKKGPPHWLALRGALWVAAHHGSSEGIRYLFALARHGWLIEPDAFSGALVLLAQAAAMSGDDKGVESHFFDPVPRDLDDWHEQLMHLSDAVREPTSVCRDESVLESLVAEAFSLAAETGNASSYDAWLSLHLILRPVLKGVLSAVGQLSPSPHGTLKASIEQLREVVADSGGGYVHIKSNLSHTPLMHNFAVASGLVDILKAKAGDRWKQRVRERPSVPRAILEQLETGNLDGLPDSWKYASSAVAWPLAMCLQSDLPTTVVRSSSIPYDHIVASPLRESLLTSLLGADRSPELIDAIFRRASQYHSGRPVGIPVRKLARELSRLKDSGDATVIPDDPVADRVESWLDENHDALINAISSFVLDYWIEDITRRAEEAERMRLSDLEEAIAFLHDAVKDYRWCEFLHHKLSIALDENGDQSQAIQSIRDAILLKPDSHMFWQSLGVILRGQRHRLHGNVASSMGLYLSENQESAPRS